MVGSINFILWQHAHKHILINYYLGCVWIEALGGEGRGEFAFLLYITDYITCFSKIN